jgi:hypothetical protein
MEAFPLTVWPASGAMVVAGAMSGSMLGAWFALRMVLRAAGRHFYRFRLLSGMGCVSTTMR